MADVANIELAVAAAADVENADAGMLRLFLDSSNSNQLSTKDEAGTVVVVGGGGGGAVSSVFTRTGAVTAQAGDYDFGDLSGELDDAQHGDRGGDTLHALVVASGAAGFMSGADKEKLDGLSGGGVAEYIAVTTDKTTSDHAVPPATDVLLTKDITLTTGTKILCHLDANPFATSGNKNAYFSIYVAGNLRRTGRAFLDATSQSGFCALTWLETGLTPGDTYTVAVKWSVDAATTASISAATSPNTQQASLALSEAA